MLRAAASPKSSDVRMVHYFAVASATSALALSAAAALGLAPSLGFELDPNTHFLVALLAAMIAIGTNTMLILFMIVTGRILREAVRARDLPQEFLEELNQFFARKAAYPAALLAAVSVVVAGVLASIAGAHGVAAEPFAARPRGEPAAGSAGLRCGDLQGWPPRRPATAAATKGAAATATAWWPKA